MENRKFNLHEMSKLFRLTALKLGVVLLSESEFHSNNLPDIRNNNVI